MTAFFFGNIYVLIFFFIFRIDFNFLFFYAWTCQTISSHVETPLRHLVFCLSPTCGPTAGTQFSVNQSPS
jgi:hypothetical protein